MEEKILVTRSSMPPKEEYFKEIDDLWETRWLTNMGVKHQKLEQELAKFLNVQNISLYTNGHLALEAALKGMNLSGEVITTPFTFASTTHAIVRAGLTPVFCDVDPITCTIDVNKIEELITDKTCAIVPVHVYGQVCDVEKIGEIAKKHNLKVIYDAAHVFGTRFKGKGIAEFGDASMFSFHATKVFHSIEGGCVAYHDSDYERFFYYEKNFGIKDEDTIVKIAGNAKMNEFQAAMGLCNLRHVDEYIISRKRAYERYLERLKDVSGIRTFAIQENVESNYAYFPVIVDGFGCTRDELKEKLEKKNIYTRKYFYPLITDFDCYKEKYDSHKTPIAKYISEHVLTLPLYEGLTDDQVDYICDSILECENE